jgi:hypothetical protein
MSRMSIQDFVSASSDPELTQYRILQAVQEYYRDFSHNRLYPALADLIHLYESLVDFRQRRDDLHNKLPQTLVDVDPLTNTLRYERPDTELPDLERIFTLIEWALPILKKAIEEGTSIYRFVEERLRFEQVGILPMYRDEGYWFFSDQRMSLLHLLRYELSIFSSSTERFRTLKTRLIESLHQSQILVPFESIKLWLIEKYHDLPNPATYACAAEIEFPYEETLLPIAKRKFMTLQWAP